MKFSVVIPCFKSTAALNALVADILSRYQENCHEIILVQDGPDDDTFTRLQDMSSKEERVRVIELDSNRGQHHATLCGLQHADASYSVITLDDDGQVQASEISKLLAKARHTNADITYGLYTTRYHEGIRKVFSQYFSQVISRYSNIPSQGSSFKLIAPRVVASVKSYSASFVYLDEVLAWYSRSTVFTEVNHIPRPEGSSGYTWLKLIGLGWKIILNYTILPYRLMLYGGLGLAIGSVFQARNKGVEFGQLASSVENIPIGILVFFVLGFIMVAFGLVGSLQRKRKTEYPPRLKGQHVTS